MLFYLDLHQLNQAKITSALCLSASAWEAISLRVVTRKLKSIQLKPILLLSPGHQLATKLHIDTNLATCRVCPLLHFASISIAIIGTAYLTILHALPPSDNNSFFQLATLITYAYYTHCLSKYIHMKKAKKIYVQLNLVVVFLLFLPNVRTRRVFFTWKSSPEILRNAAYQQILAGSVSYYRKHKIYLCVSMLPNKQ